jgi:solute:Na+ symporter, SSS family
MNALDYIVLLGTVLGIAAYGVWGTRGRRDLHSYLKGAGKTPWLVIGLSVMATQASAITFMSTPGQGFADGLGFVQFYFGVPIALTIISIFFLPIYRKLDVYTAYEYLGRRFDSKTRLLGAGLFLLQRGLGAGITIYAPAIILSTVFGWPLAPTIIGSGLVVIIYTASGGSDAVNLTQKYQMAVIFAGMATAFIVLLAKLPAGVSFADAMAVARGFGKLHAVNLSLDPKVRYTLWSGLLGGTFLQLSYFGTDQSQVQRYISGTSLHESRLGLLFNSICKIPMQFSILLLGVLVFVFYQFQAPPLVFNQAAWNRVAENKAALESQFAAAHERERQSLQQWIDARHSGDRQAQALAQASALAAQKSGDDARQNALAIVKKTTAANDNDYVFITFILHNLPHGVIGLLIAAFFGAALSSKAAELNALGSCTTVDVYRHLIRPAAPDAHYLAAGRWFTILWGAVAIAFALLAHLAENLIQAVNIVGSIFYGVMLGLFIAGFFVRYIGGTAIFCSALAAQTLVFILYFKIEFSYLWLIPIGCCACVLGGLLLQPLIGKTARVVS